MSDKFSDFYLQRLVQNKLYCYVVSFSLSLIIATLVYLTGGTTKVYANLMYVAIIISASTCGRNFGLIHAFFSSILIGPFMPLNVSTRVMQEPANWIIRSAIYCLVAFVVGKFTEYYVGELSKSEAKDQRIISSQISMIFALVKLAESRDDDTGKHISRVAEYCRMLTIQLASCSEFSDNINNSYIENIHKAAPLHDIGKVGIPDNILLKPDKLSPEEFEIMKRHTVIGSETLQEVISHFPDNQFLQLGIKIARHHHEKWDGSGYPDALVGDQIPLSARIMALADVYDALRSKRVYKDSFTHDKAREIILSGSGTHFDPMVVDAFFKLDEVFDKIFTHAHDVMGIVVENSNMYSV